MVSIPPRQGAMRRLESSKSNPLPASAVGVSSFFPGQGSLTRRFIVLIQEPFSDDLIRTPLKVDSPALPGAAQEWNPTSLKGRESVACSNGKQPAG